MGNKVIAVGLGHTGTRSLNQALIMLGIPAKHWPHDRETYHELANGVYRLSILEKYDAVTDVTLAPFYAQLDQEYPGSKFILTVLPLRQTEGFLTSIFRMLGLDLSAPDHGRSPTGRVGGGVRRGRPSGY